jgi:hypothetical protein
MSCILIKIGADPAINLGVIAVFDFGFGPLVAKPRPKIGLLCHLTRGQMYQVSHQ